MNELSVGAAMRDITPSWPVSLAGFASREGTTDHVTRPIHVRVAVLDDTNNRLVIASADLLNWGAEQAPRLRQDLATVAGTIPDRVLLAATHSHSSPQTSFRVSRYVGVADAQYVSWLTEQTIDAAKDAVASLRPARGVRASGDFTLGRYRRVAQGSGVAHQLSDAGPSDPLLTAIRYLDDEGKPITTLVHYTCHPVIVADDAVSPDFAGHAMSVLEGETGAPALYLQGCCGDINPDFGQTRQIRRGTDADVQRVGAALAERVTVLLNDAPEQISPGPLDGSVSSIELPFQPFPDQAQLTQEAADSGPRAEWARLMLGRWESLIPAVPLSVQVLRLGGDLNLLALNGELSVEYGLHVRAQTDNACLPVAYANGMVGYVTTARQLAEGGYEPIESILYYALPAPFSPEIEARITDAIDTLTEGMT